MMVRPPRNEKAAALKKGAWSCEEDKKLTTYINKYGIWNWSQMPKFAGLSRSGKSCRLRWMNYLRPDVKLGNFTEEEDRIIFDLHEKLGSRWSAIAKQLPGRTDNEVKNHWHTRLKKRLLVNNINSVNPNNNINSVNPNTKTKDGEISITCEIQENSHRSSSNSTQLVNDALEVSNLEAHCNVQKSPNQPASVTSTSPDWDFGVNIVESTELNTSLSEMIGDYDQIFWNEPFFMENLSMEGQQLGYAYSQFDDLLWSLGPISPYSSFINDVYSDCIMYNVYEKENMSSIGEFICQF